VNEGPQGYGGGHRGGGGYRGGRTSGRGLVLVITMMRKDILQENSMLLRRPWCSHCRKNTHPIGEFPDLIAKLEYHAR
jgi:hypothetical protein